MKHFIWTAAAQLQQSPLAIGEYYFAALPQEDSVALTVPWTGNTFHRYPKMISDNEIEIDYILPASSPLVKKRYIRN